MPIDGLDPIRAAMSIDDRDHLIDGSRDLLMRKPLRLYPRAATVRR